VAKTFKKGDRVKYSAKFCRQIVATKDIADRRFIVEEVVDVRPVLLKIKDEADGRTLGALASNMEHAAAAEPCA
jgi:hypothetical protein